MDNNVIARFRRGVNDICVLLENYLA